MGARPREGCAPHGSRVAYGGHSHTHCRSASMGVRVSQAVSEGETLLTAPRHKSKSLFLGRPIPGSDLSAEVRARGTSWQTRSEHISAKLKSQALRLQCSNGG